MKIKPADTTPIAKPIEATAPAKAAESVQSEVAPESSPAQLSPEEAAQQSKARDTAAKAQFSQRVESLDGRLAAIEEGAEVAQVSPQQFVKQAQGFVDQIAANPDNAAAKHTEVGKALDKLSNVIGGMNGDQAFSAVGDLIKLDLAVDNAKGAVERKLDFAPDSQKAGLQQVWQKLDRLDKAVDRAQDA